MGEVYRAQDTTLHRPVAIKILPAENLADPDRKRRFIQEARAASALNHAGIVTVFDAGSDEGRDFIVMEYVAGTTLDRVVSSAGLPLPKTLTIASAIADALAAAHRAGIIHRDLKPSNVMVTETGAVKVLDFGVAKLLEPLDADDATRTAARTVEGTTVGTPAYMSPEQAESRPVDARSDIFSFGSLLYEMITGHRAFEGSSSVSGLGKIVNEEPPPPTRWVPAIPIDFEKLILRCLRKQPERRFQSMADLKAALDDIALESGDTGASHAAARPLRSIWPWVASGVAMILLLSVAGFLAVRWLATDTDSPPLQAVPLTAIVGQVRYPALSPDGDRVAFTWTGPAGNNTDIYVQQIGAGSPLRLTTD